MTPRARRNVSSRAGTTPIESPGAMEAEAELVSLGDPEDAAFLQRFFKTGPGEYGAGDRFLGIRVPVVRKLARKYRQMPLREAIRLLHSPYHEARLLALVILVHSYEKGDAETRSRVYDLYLANTKHINNWDLVDASAHRIVGAHLDQVAESPLPELARSSGLWERRIAIIATLARIQADRFDDTIRIAEMLVDDDHDLIHKATGWMLREVAKRDMAVAEAFLVRHCRTMPRTMLRYAIERFPKDLRAKYMRGTV